MTTTIDVHEVLNKPEFALLVLNQPICDEERLIRLWNLASVTVCVDGGANRWHCLASKPENASKVSRATPDMLTGDFDSIADSVLAEYKNSKCEVVETPDQDRTDFTKAVAEVVQRRKGTKNIVAFVENSGRLDQILANVETLFIAEQLRKLDSSHPRLFLASSTTISFLLPSGETVVRCGGGGDGPVADCHVGLIPVGGRADGVKTRGLKWNLDGSQALEFGVLVSTSNALEEGATEIFVDTPKPILFTMEI